MNTFTSPDTQEINRLEKLRAQIAADVEAMKEKERSLREYEQRLRALVELTQQSQSSPAYPHRPNSTPPVDANLDAEWEKYQRAHALLEAARRGLTEDRLVMKAREADLLKLEEQLSRREAWIKVRESELVALEKQRHEVKPPAKSRSSFTQAPFVVVKNLLTGEG